MAAARDHPPRRLEAVDAVEVGRVADGAADVAAQLERRQPGGHRGGGPARGATGGAGDVPRVVGGAVDVVEGLEVAGVEGGVGLPDHDRPGRLQPGHRQGVGGGHVPGQLRGPRGGHQAFGLPDVLDRHGQAVEGTGRPSPPRWRCRRRRPPPRARSGSRATTAFEARVLAVDAVEQVVGQLAGRERPVTDGRHQLGGGGGGGVEVHPRSVGSGGAVRLSSRRPPAWPAPRPRPWRRSASGCRRPPRRTTGRRRRT